jgi:glycosyltransferase involved in cell wall biosynthesis
MKLLVVASTFPASESDPVPAFVRDQLIALKRLRPDLEISVLAPHDARSRTASHKRRELYDEYRFHYFWPFAAETLAGRGIMPALEANPLKYLLIPFLFIGEFAALLRLSRRLRPDVIYAHWFTPQGVIASWVSRMTGTPFVFTTHTSDVDVWRRIPWIGRHVVRGSVGRARAFTAVSRRSMRKLQDFFSSRQWELVRKKGSIIPMGVALPEPRFPQATEPTGETVILFLGRLVEKKGVQFLLPAYAAVRHEIGRSSLVIAGDGPMLGRLIAQATELGLREYVRFVGFVSGAEKSNMLQLADIFVVPSIVTESGDAEGLPVSLMEALAYGKICIATAESGADEILTSGQDGFVIPEKNVAALSSSLVEAAGLDPALRKRMEAAARITARPFDWEAIASRHDESLLSFSDREL